MLRGEGIAEAEASWYASWDASGTLVAVISTGRVKVTVINVTTKQRVSQALFCIAQRGPSLCVRRQTWLESLRQQRNLELLQILPAGLCRVWSYSPCCCVGAEGLSHVP